MVHLVDFKQFSLETASENSSFIVIPSASRGKDGKWRVAADIDSIMTYVS